MSIIQALENDGWLLESELIRDEFNGRDGCSVWSVTIHRNGKFKTPYTMGAAHRHYPNGGKFQCPYSTQHLTADQFNRLKQSKPNKPTLDYVLYSIVSDAQCVAFGQTFEDFAVEMGYDEDSRTAERAYNACRDEYFALIRLCGQDGFERLCEMFQDF